MRIGGVCLASALAAGLLLATPVLAQVDAGSGGGEATRTAQVPAAPTLAMQAAARAAEIGRRSGAHADDLAAVQSHYGATPDKSLWIEGGTLSARARAAIEEIGKADDWGLKASAFVLPASSPGSDADALIEAEATLTLAVLKYARHARGGRMDPSKLTEAIDRTANLLPPARVLADIAEAPAADAYLRRLHPQHPQFERLRRLYNDLRNGKAETPPPAPVAEEAQEQPARRGRKRPRVAAKPQTPPPLSPDRVLFNMEQWRWMPDDLGNLHVIVNVPEYQFRVIKAGQVIHSERVVVGAVATQTPIFSKDMGTVVFQPAWGVPPSIKVKQLLPGLLAGRDTISSRGYTLNYRGRNVSPLSVDWRSVDIRKVSIVQPPGPGNALGQVKFLFPNKHDVYLHDTPAKSLFNAEVRAFSNGCVRVRNPMRFAEIILTETSGWSPQRVASAARGRAENEVRVQGHMGMHLTYFTVVVGDDDRVQTFRDIYGHEPRVLGALEGRNLALIAKRPQDLSAIRSSLLGRSSARRAATAARDRTNTRDRDRAAAREREDQRVRAAAPRPRLVAAPRRSNLGRAGGGGGGGGGFFSLFGN